MTGQRTDGAPVTLPKTFWRKLLGPLTAVFMITSLLFVAMAESAAAATPSGHATISFACTGKRQILVDLYNDGGPGAAQIMFQFKNNLTGYSSASVDVSVADSPLRTSFPLNPAPKVGDSYNLTVTGPSNYSKTFIGVFNCGSPGPTQVTPQEPKFHDVDGTVDDTYTIVPTTGVVYKVDGKTMTGTNPGRGTVTVTAEAAPGCNCTLVNYKPWTYKFTDNNPVVPVAPAQPIYNDVDKSYTIPFTYVDCFVYHAPRSNETLTPGKLYEHGPGEVFIDATLKDGSGCVLKEGATTHFKHTFPADQVLPTTTQPAPLSTTVRPSPTTSLPAPTTTVPPASTSTVPVPLKGNNPPPAQSPIKVTPPVVGNVPAPQPPAVVQVPVVSDNGLNPGFNAETGWEDVVGSPAPQRTNYLLWASLLFGLGLASGAATVVSVRSNGEA